VGKGFLKGWLELLRKEMETKLAILESLFMNKVCKCVTFTCTVGNGLLKGWLELLMNKTELLESLFLNIRWAMVY
jgi:hypothetical protein